MVKPGAIRFTLLFSLLLPALAGATELYRYVNAKGVTVLDRLGVPPEYISKGYEVLNDQGRVVKVIPPAPSAEEMRRQLADKARASSDAQLLRLYSTVDDVDRAKARKLTELDGVISAAQGNLQLLRTQQANLQSQAADQERAGRQVPEHLVAQIDNLKAEQAGLQKDILRYQEGRKQAEASFAADQARLLELIGTRR
ncbi:DUF4124 domain-containing protein [Pseudomonas cavernicola]|uniref:DUF4124 domain-containing protein n=1 Tax=Pseudomonas cavernicola TaxID=2320866 RepID=A0A418XK72_9PSED|nr:DUF4124 domain-containing protein [Pseudomonas cavernicola]RJG12878.1 DUF4124 domain-containing protein [Pseudomonas cavernicola]